MQATDADDDTSSEGDLGLYLRRLGFDAPPPPELSTLAELQRRHTEAFAFENLSPLLRLPVPIDRASLERKLLHEGRGGYCYELNGLYLRLLRALGFEARGITGRVLLQRPEGAWPSRTHMLVALRLDGIDYLSDVGFGGMVPTGPLRLDTEDAQRTPHEAFRIARRADGYRVLSAEVGGEWRAMYMFDLQEQRAIDFEVGNWYVSTHAHSPFVQRLMAARAAPGVRHALANGDYSLHRLDGPTEKRRIADVDELIALLRDVFGIRVPVSHPALRPTLAALLAAE